MTTRISFILILLITLTLSGCATTSVVMLESGVSYPPTQYVQILTQAPTRNFKQIAILEARGPINTPMTDLLESIKQKAAEVGADAVLPTENATTQQQSGIIFNPLLGGYQTFGGGAIPIIRGIAIKYSD